MLICDHLVLLLIFRKLYEPHGGNQVDDLSPASSHEFGACSLMLSFWEAVVSDFDRPVFLKNEIFIFKIFFFKFREALIANARFSL